MATATKVIVRNAFSPRHPYYATIGEGQAKQNHKQECDVNHILARFQKTGVITHRQKYEPQYEDATAVDFQHALNLVNSAQAMFNDLPSSVRKRFDHDPAEFMAFVNDPENMPEMIKMGLAIDKTPVPEPPQKVEIVNPSPEA